MRHNILMEDDDGDDNIDNGDSIDDDSLVGIRFRDDQAQTL